MRPVFLLFCVALAAFPQDSPDAVVTQLLRAMYNGDSSAAAPLLTREAVVFGSGGNTANPLRQLTTFKGRIGYLRHIATPTPDTALAVVVWRNPDGGPMDTAGMLDVLLRKEEAGWRVFTWRFAPMPVRPPRPVTQKLLPDADGWRTLFNGSTTAGLMRPDGNATLPEGWVITDGALRTTPARARILLQTEELYKAFEMEWEWKADAKANSGVVYRFFTENTGQEYQIADDDGDPGAKADDREKSGAVYGVVAVARRAAKPLGEWNQSRLVLQNGRAEHWLNGVKTAEFPAEVLFPSPVALQQHGPGVAFRKIRIRPLP